jgi:Tfp pilus assembly protein PilV
MKHQHGFSLVDALIGLLVLTLGLLAVLRGQPLLRQHAEIARQRSEAVRLAQEDIERQRSTLGVPVAGELIVDEALASTRYRLVRTVDAAAWPIAAAVTVIVHWSDRAGAPQQVLLATLVATPDPALAGAAVLPR